MFRKARHSAATLLLTECFLDNIRAPVCVSACNYPTSKDVIEFHQQP